MINFKDTLGLTNVPINSAAFTHWKKKEQEYLEYFSENTRPFNVSWDFSFYDSSCYLKCLVGLFHSLSNAYMHEEIFLTCVQ